MLELKHIKKSFDGVNVLKNINLQIEDGEIVSILGPSGCGKTTLLNILAALDKPTEGNVILEVKNLKQYFKIDHKLTVKAIDDISFKIYKGETFGLVGESGSGKSTTGRSIIRLYQPTAGEVIFKGKNIAKKL